MVNLNLISKDKFQKMGFKNKSTVISFIKTVLQIKIDSTQSNSWRNTSSQKSTT